jgi:GT2 family glycosyltransferase
MRRSDLEAVGMLDERYGIGMFEDDDLAEKVRRQLHLRVVCAEDVYIHHIGQASFALLSSVQYNHLFEQNRRRFEQTWQVTWTPHRPRPGVAPAISKII